MSPSLPAEPKPPAAPKVAAPKAPEAPKAPKAPEAPKAGAPKGAKGPKAGKGIKGGPKGAAPVLIIVAIIAAVVAVVIIRSHSKTNPNKARNVSVFKLAIGDCVVQPTSIKAELATLQVVPCSRTHTQEVFATPVFTNASGAYPGDTALQTFAQGACLQAFKPYVGTAYPDSRLFYTFLLPSVRSWGDVADRTVTCFVTTTGEPLTRSVKGSGM